MPARAPRLGLIGEPFLGRATPEARAHLDVVARDARGGAGARVEPVELPPLMAPVCSAVIAVSRAELGRDPRGLATGGTLTRIGPASGRGIELGRCIPADLYLRAQRIRRQARLELAPLLARYDALVMPSALGPAPDREHDRGP